MGDTTATVRNTLGGVVGTGTTTVLPTMSIAGVSLPETVTLSTTLQTGISAQQSANNGIGCTGTSLATQPPEITSTVLPSLMLEHTGKSADPGTSVVSMGTNTLGATCLLEGTENVGW